MTNSATIPVSSLPTLDALLAKLNKKAAKHGFNTISYKTVGDTQFVPQSVKTSFEGVTISDREVMIEVVDIEFPEISFGFDDQELIGLTEHVEGIDVLHNFTEGLVDLAHERGTCACDHCGHNRKRNKVYFVAPKGDSASYKRIGSTCIKDYFPSSSGSILSRFQFCEEVFKFIKDVVDGDFEVSFGSAPAQYKVKDILATGCYFADRYGYISSTKASEDISGYTVSTSNQVREILGDFTKWTSEMWSGVYSDKADEILEWFNSTEEDSDYFANCREIIEKGYCVERFAGYIVGLYGAYNYFMNKKKREEEEANKPVSEHVGTIGVRQTFVGIIEKVIAFETYYGDGVGYLTTVNCDGNMVKYFNLIRLKDFHRNCLEDFEGLKVQFDAAVKEHDTYKGVKMTQVSRATKGKILS